MAGTSARDRDRDADACSRQVQSFNDDHDDDENDAHDDDDDDFQNHQPMRSKLMHLLVLALISLV